MDASELPRMGREQTITPLLQRGVMHEAAEAPLRHEGGRPSVSIVSAIASSCFTDAVDFLAPLRHTEWRGRFCNDLRHVTTP